MKIYVRDEINRLHDRREDAHCTSSFKDKVGNKWEIVIIADGLSGYHGAVASGKSVNAVRNYLTEILSRDKEYSPENALKGAVLHANEELEKIGTTYTTIDTVLLSEDKLYLAHLGDSRVYLGFGSTLELVTEDQGDSNGPKNYIGCTYIEGNSKNIAARVELAVTELLSKGYARPSEILLATDGLMSRVTDAEITEIWADAHKVNYDPSAVLEKFVERIRRPVGKLSELTENQIRRIVGGIPDFNLGPGDSKEQMIEKILDAYVRRESGELVKRIDGNLKYDDATLILVDLKDSVGNSFDELTKVKIKLPEVEGERDVFRADAIAKGERISQLTEEKSSLDDTIRTEREERRIEVERSLAEIQGLNQTISSQQLTIGDYVHKLVEMMDNTYSLVERYFTHLKSDGLPRPPVEDVNLIQILPPGERGKLLQIFTEGVKLKGELPTTSGPSLTKKVVGGIGKSVVGVLKWGEEKDE